MTNLKSIIFVVTPILALLVPLGDTTLYLLGAASCALGGALAWWLAKHPKEWQQPIPPDGATVVHYRKAA